MLAPLQLNGFLASSKPIGSSNKWIVAVIDGDLLVDTKAEAMPERSKSDASATSDA